MVRVSDFGKNNPVNPRTGYPAYGFNSDKINSDFYKTPHFRGGSEYCMGTDFYFFAPKVLGVKNIRRLENCIMRRRLRLPLNVQTFPN